MKACRVCGRYKGDARDCMNCKRNRQKRYARTDKGKGTRNKARKKYRGTLKGKAAIERQKEKRRRLSVARIERNLRRAADRERALRVESNDSNAVVYRTDNEIETVRQLPPADLSV